MSVLYGSMLM